VQHAITAVIRGRALFLNRSRIATRVYLDVGCGPNNHEHFINLDYDWHPGIDICWDLTTGIPLGDRTLQGIFTEHCLEHIPFSATDAVLADFRRLLKPGGTVRIVVPDGELYLTRYCDLLRKLTDQALPYADNERYQGRYTPIMSVNRIFHDHQHQFIYDFAAMRLLLEKNGFTDIRKETIGSGRDATLLIDTPYRAVESLYVEATSP
jgi:predicted SAM-dependent methyltransferase